MPAEMREDSRNRGKEELCKLSSFLLYTNGLAGNAIEKPDGKRRRPVKKELQSSVEQKKKAQDQRKGYREQESRAGYGSRKLEGPNRPST